jgi:hypothetical protein
LDAASKDDLIKKIEFICNSLCNYAMNQMTYEQYKPWEVALAVIEIARTLCGFRKQHIKIWQLMHGNEEQI